MSVKDWEILSKLKGYDIGDIISIDFTHNKDYFAEIILTSKVTVTLMVREKEDRIFHFVLKLEMLGRRLDIKIYVGSASDPYPPNYSMIDIHNYKLLWPAGLSPKGFKNKLNG